MPGLHGLKGDVAFCATNLADHDAVGTLTKGGFEQVEHVHAAALLPFLPMLRTTSRTQLWCGTFSSGVSSMVTILASGA